MQLNNVLISYPYFTIYFFLSLRITRGPGSSVGIATSHGLDGPGSDPGGDDIFRTCPDQP
jgi:hypothetical protein